MLLFALAELQALASGPVLHLIGGTLLLGRAAHAAAFASDHLPAAFHFKARTFGTAVTMTTTGVLATLLLKSALF
jgi:uncharacterized membrane protein YecN with MAPEG domain